MRYRKLRIVWSVGCGIVCLLLIALWVRSYRWNDNLMVRTSAPSPGSNSTLVVCSNWGFLQFLPSELLDPRAFGFWSQEAWERTDVGFEWRADGAIKVPDLFPIVVAMAFGIAPWIRWSRRFSFRTAMLVMALVAVVLGLFVIVTG